MLLINKIILLYNIFYYYNQIEDENIRQKNELTLKNYKLNNLEEGFKQVKDKINALT